MLSPKYRPVQIFWQAIPMGKAAPQMTQTTKTNSVPPTNAADSQQLEQLNEQWKDEGDADSGLEDGAQAGALHHQGEGVGTFLKEKPVLKSVRYVAKQKSKHVSGVPPPEAKSTETSSGAKGQLHVQVTRKSIWDRLGSRIGDGSRKPATVGGKVPIRLLD